TRHEPSACGAMARSMVTSRIWSNARPLGRIGRFLEWFGYQPLNLSRDAEQQRSLGGKPVFSYIVKTRPDGTPGIGLSGMVTMDRQSLHSSEFLENISARSQDIFRRLVERYLETGEPV